MNNNIQKESTNKLNLEGFGLHYIDEKPYIILSQLAKVFNVKAPFIANATCRVSPTFVNDYVIKKAVEIDGKTRPRKFLDIAGLPLFLEKISYGIDNELLIAFSSYVDSLLGNTVQEEAPKAKIVEFNSITPCNEKSESENNSIQIVEATENATQSEDSLNNEALEEASITCKNVALEAENETASVVNALDKSSDIDSMLAVMDGVLTMLAERASLKEENLKLQAHITELEQEIANLKAALENSQSKSESILKKASLIRDYVLANK